jgi:hypothetical protein
MVRALFIRYTLYSLRRTSIGLVGRNAVGYLVQYEDVYVLTRLFMIANRSESSSLLTLYSRELQCLKDKDLDRMSNSTVYFILKDCLTDQS